MGIDWVQIRWGFIGDGEALGFNPLNVDLTRTQASQVGERRAIY